MGLFDPPPLSILKRIPRETVPTLAAIQTFAEYRLPESLGPTAKASIAAIVMATYVEDQARAGLMPLSNWNRAYIRTLAQNCLRVAGPAAVFAEEILAALVESGDALDED